MTQPYDPYTPRNGPSSQNTKTAALQAQIDETVDIMRNNIDKVTERGHNLNELENRTQELSVSAQTFRKGANKVRKDMWWKDMKMRIIIGIAVAVIIVIIVVSIVETTKKKN